ncbi:hypothetical protein [uncultured Pontibacter sp.]|uniref:hypothetical protein n=1 Tax=uncultured Pontibacter sp. TaxID=453356 RepID=UPI002638D42D|nr:hypothetical protein [uncultured Pontibacter sp.]
MSKSFLLLLAFLTCAAVTSIGQGRALTFQEAENQGVPFQHLDSLYKSAVHTDEHLAVFKTTEEQKSLQVAYAKLLQDLGNFLRENGFKWEKQIRGANRIYFRPDGSIDYFLFHFPEGQLAPDKEKKFNRLLSLFIQDYKFELTAGEKFAQCSAVKYSDI